MFIAELDRPWIDTPFLLQGFLVEDEVELAQLRRYCKFVLVDPRRSAADLFPALEEPRSPPRAVASLTKAVPGSDPAKGSKDAAGKKPPPVSQESGGEISFSGNRRLQGSQGGESALKGAWGTGAADYF